MQRGARNETPCPLHPASFPRYFHSNASPVSFSNASIYFARWLQEFLALRSYGIRQIPAWRNASVKQKLLPISRTFYFTPTAGEPGYFDEAGESSA